MCDAICAGVLRDQRGHQVPGAQVTGGCELLARVLGTEPGSSVRAASTRNCLSHLPHSF